MQNAANLCARVFYVHSYLLPDKNRNSKQKTPVAKRSVNPVWNYTFAYDDVSLNELSERALELTIWDHDRLASNEFLGGVRFSLGTGKAHAIIIIISTIITTRSDHCHIAQSIRIVQYTTETMCVYVVGSPFCDYERYSAV